MISVVTSITGGYDELLDQPKGRAEFVCFTDRPIESATWDIRPAYNFFKSDQLNSRVPKILTHRFVDSEYLIWIDGNIRLKVPPKRLIEELGEKGITFFEHRQMGEWEPFHVYREIDYCKSKGVADPNLLNTQKKHYPNLDERERVMAGTVIIRKNTPEINKLFDEWWCEFTRFPTRDQVSLMKVMTGKVDVAPHSFYGDDLIEMVFHNKTL